MSGEFIFMYCTLKNDYSSSMSQVLSSHCEYYSPGHIQEKMYEIGGHPGAIT